MFFYKESYLTSPLELWLTILRRKHVDGYFYQWIFGKLCETSPVMLHSLVFWKQTSRKVYRVSSRIWRLFSCSIVSRYFYSGGQFVMVELQLMLLCSWSDWSRSTSQCRACWCVEYRPKKRLESSMYNLAFESTITGTLCELLLCVSLRLARTWCFREEAHLGIAWFYPRWV